MTDTEDNMTELGFMTFGEAVENLKKGNLVARAGWNGKGMFLSLNLGSADRSLGDQSHFDGVPGRLLENGCAGTVTRLPNINMRTASGATVMGWLASQTDVLAEDWVMVEA